MTGRKNRDEIDWVSRKDSSELPRKDYSLIRIDTPGSYQRLERHIHPALGHMADSLFPASHEIDGVRKEKERLTAAWTSHTFGSGSYDTQVSVLGEESIISVAI